MVDFRKFLKAPSDDVPVLFLGGFVAFAADRTLRLSALPEKPPGFYAATVNGRKAVLGEAAAPFGLDALPSKGGHFAGGYVALGGARAERIELLAEAEPEALAPIRARLHPTGVYLLGNAEFETEVEMVARARLDEGLGLAEVRGVSATLRTAFALATAWKAARELSTSVAPAEITAHVRTIAEEGAGRARELVTALVLRRQEEAEQRRRLERDQNLARAHEAVREGVRATRERVGRLPDPALTPAERVDRALTAAQATLLHVRQLTSGQLEVRYRFLGEIFISVVDAHTLHVFDAGICLDGADEEVTLESLPSVIREAIDSGRLVITRR